MARKLTSYRKKYLNFAVSEARRKLKLRAIEYKGGQCQMPGCGYKKCPAALQFHHTDPSKKDFSISGRNVKWETIQPELDKTILVCATCHIEIHDAEAQVAREKLRQELKRSRAGSSEAERRAVNP